MCNISVVKYHQFLHDYVFETFDQAILEQRDSVGEKHPDLAKVLMKASDFQSEAEKLIDAMNNYLDVLIIQRIINGSTYSKVSEMLFKIGSIHREKSNHRFALNAFHQAFGIAAKILKMQVRQWALSLTQFD